MMTRIQTTLRRRKGFKEPDWPDNRLHRDPEVRLARNATVLQAKYELPKQFADRLHEVVASTGRYQAPAMIEQLGELDRYLCLLIDCGPYGAFLTPAIFFGVTINFDIAPTYPGCDERDALAIDGAYDRWLETRDGQKVTLD